MVVASVRGYIVTRNEYGRATFFFDQLLLMFYLARNFLLSQIRSNKSVTCIFKSYELKIATRQEAVSDKDKEDFENHAAHTCLSLQM